MSKVISEDALRRALAAIAEPEAGQSTGVSANIQIFPKRKKGR
ncbi:hypothetical protein [Accumulibacter sp.]|nr:hypothetical protein [Accumulibacter sp.]